MKNLKKIALISLISASLATGGIAMAKDHSKLGKRSHHMGSPMQVFRGVDLTDVQKTQIKSIFNDTKAEVKPIHKELLSLKAKLEELSRSDVYSATQVANVAQQIADLQRQNMEIMTRAQNQAWSLLTPEQKAKALAKIEEKKAKNEKRKQKRQSKKQKNES